jgi:hypothetical protein
MKTLRKKTLQAATACLMLAAASAAWSTDLTIPNTFVKGSPATAATVNENFSATAISVNSKQDRVVGACAADGQAVRGINPDGSVVCETFGTTNGQLSAAEAIANSVQIFDTHDFTGASVATLSVGTSLGTQVSVAANTTITHISALLALSARGNIRFVIYDHPAHNRLLMTDPQPVAPASAPVWVDSAPFTFTLVAGSTYDIGAATDQSTTWSFDGTANATTNFTNTGFVFLGDFNNPSVLGDFTGADIHFRLYGLLP